MVTTNILLYKAIFEHEYSVIEIVDRFESDILNETKRK